ncbi:MAG TPA: CHASE2 domain-containing protein [Bryobacteraceae bacterium]
MRWPKTRWSAKQFRQSAALLAACLVLALFADLTFVGRRIDYSAYDAIYTLFPPQDWKPHSAILAFDEAAYTKYGGARQLRSMLVDALKVLGHTHPKTVGIDIVLADAMDESTDARLEAALRDTPNVVLSCELPPPGTQWELPLKRFAQYAKGVGHVHPEENQKDGVSRRIPLEIAEAGQHYWALALEAFRVSVGAPYIIESPQDLAVGKTIIPAARYDNERMLWLRYRTAGVERLSLVDAIDHPERAAQLFDGKVVFIGATALAGRYDQSVPPYGGGYISGIEVHAQALETLAEGRFITNATELPVLSVCLLIAVAIFAIFAYFSGWTAYLSAGVVLVFAHVVPVWYFKSDLYFPYFASFATAWLSLVASAGFEYFVVRKQLATSQSERDRYQQAIHFVAHEMRTPLSSIQGQSEMMGKYALPEDKRKQMVESINSESKRLGRLIQTFLDVERLSDGQMQLKREAFETSDIVTACARRVRPLADRKKIQLHIDEPIEGSLNGDRELMEYAIYNLMTNAVKYSPGNTQVWVAAHQENGHVKVSVKDQGIGMDEQEQKKVFQKFYRTKRAENSGEAGTGIGLSIVDQIVTHHGGKMELTSAPGKGSCFTIILPARKPAPV